MKYLPLYYEWMETGSLPYDGLCHCLNPDDEYLDLFYDNQKGGYWGYYSEFFDHPVYTQDINRDAGLFYKLQYDFNPLRQNIVLLIAAMNNEL